MRILRWAFAPLVCWRLAGARNPDSLAILIRFTGGNRRNGESEFSAESQTHRAWARSRLPRFASCSNTAGLFFFAPTFADFASLRLTNLSGWSHVAHTRRTRFAQSNDTIATRTRQPRDISRALGAHACVIRCISCRAAVASVVAHPPCHRSRSRMSPSLQARCHGRCSDGATLRQRMLRGALLRSSPPPSLTTLKTPFVG